MAEIPNDYLKIVEIARMLRLSRSAAHDLVVERRAIPYDRVGRSIRVRRQDVVDYLKRQRVEAVT